MKIKATVAKPGHGPSDEFILDSADWEQVSLEELLIDQGGYITVTFPDGGRETYEAIDVKNEEKK